MDKTRLFAKTELAARFFLNPLHNLSTSLH